MAQKGKNAGRQPNPEKVAATAAKNARNRLITRQLPAKRQNAVRILNSQPKTDHDYSQDSIEDILKAMEALKYEWDIDKAEWIKS